MDRRWTKFLLLGVLCFLTLGATIRTGFSQIPTSAGFERPGEPIAADLAQLTVGYASLPLDCATQPNPSANRPPDRSFRVNPQDVTLARFRRMDATPVSQPAYTPREEIALADTTNFGERYLRDVFGQPLDNEPIVVLHETVFSANSAINYFRTPHPNDNDQASYHTLIRRNGTVVYIVPPDKRAYGAGNSIFLGDRGVEAVRTNPKMPASVNNFAYHISLETPSNGNHNGRGHRGYTAAQYESLAWLVAKTGVVDGRITTHKAVDRSQSRIDPRSFDVNRFAKLLANYPRTNEIVPRCLAPEVGN